MLSEVIHTRLSYPAVLLAEQPVHQRSVHSGPLVLRTDLLKNQRLQQIGDQPVLRIYILRYRRYGLYLHPVFIKLETDVQSLRGQYTPFTFF